MTSTTTTTTADSDPLETFVRVAGDTARSDELYEILREFCHHLRNRLSSLQLSLYVGEQLGRSTEPGLWAGLRDRYRGIESAVERVQRACRPPALVPIGLPFDLLIQDRLGTWRAQLERRAMLLTLQSPPAPAEVMFDPSRMAEGLDALVAWRAGCGPEGADIRFGWSVQGRMLRVVWEERGGEPGAAEPLCLGGLARVVAAHGGVLQFAWRRGLRLEFTLPVRPAIGSGPSAGLDPVAAPAVGCSGLTRGA